MNMESVLHLKNKNNAIMSELNNFSETRFYRQGYRIVQKLGTGTAGSVYLLNGPDTKVIKHIHYARKLDNVTMTQHGGDRRKAGQSLHKEAEKLQDEVMILASLRGHAHIVAFVDHEIHIQKETNQTRLNLWILKEYYSQELSRLIQEKTLTLKQGIKYMEHIASALVFLHDTKRNIIHRDIKPDNILIDVRNNSARLDDFGQAKFVTPGVRHTTGGIGTPLYSAPEVDAKIPDYDGRKADIFSLGAVFYECLSGKPPFLENVHSQMNNDEFMNMILHNKQHQAIGQSLFINDRVWDVIYWATAPNPADRYDSVIDMHFDIKKLLSPETYNSEGVRYFQLYKTSSDPALFQRSEQNFFMAVSLDEQNKRAWLNLGNINRLKNSLEQAKECYMKALEIDPNYEMAQENLKNLYS